jgi:hypothetical protein
MKRFAVALVMVAVSAGLLLLVDAITSSAVMFCAVVLVFSGFLIGVGLLTPVKRNSRGSVL